jgi:hypothetical protein
MDHLRISRAGFHAKSIISFQKNDVTSFKLKFPGHGQTNHPRTNDAKLLGNGTNIECAIIGQNLLLILV